MDQRNHKRKFDPAFIAYGLTLVLLVPALLLGFLRLNMADGTFEFTVAHRLLTGDRLYRDIEVYTTPLSIYLNANLLRILPDSVATVSVATFISCLAIGTLLAFVVYRETKGNLALTTLFLCSVMFMGFSRWPRSSYNWNPILVATTAIILLVRSRTWSSSPAPEVTRFVLIGALLGGAIGFKQNIGILMLVVFAGWIMIRESLCQPASLKRMIFHGLGLFAGAAMVPVILAVDLYRRGTWTAFLDTAQISARYVKVMAVSYFSNFSGARLMQDVPNWLLDTPNWLLEEIALLVLLIGLAVSVFILISPWAIRWWQRLPGRRFAVLSSDPRVAFWATLYLGSFAFMFPRADYPHVAVAIPLCFAALMILVYRVFLEPSGSEWNTVVRRVSLVACLFYSVLSLVILGDFASRYESGRLVSFSEFPAQGTIATAETVRFVNEIRNSVRDVPHEAPLVIAHPFACFFYPFLGRPNPSSCYYYYGPMQKPSDVMMLTAAITAGRVHAILIHSGNISPQTLRDHALQHMQARSKVGDFILFVRHDESVRASAL